MFPNMLSCRQSIAVIALSVGWIIVPMAGAHAKGLGGVGGALGNAVGGAARGVGGALGNVGGALGNSGGSPSNADGSSSNAGGAFGGGSGGSPGNGALGNASDDRAGGSGAADLARSGNWIGAPYALKIDPRLDDCGNSLIDFLNGRKCTDRSPEATDESLDQASYPDVSEPVVAKSVPETEAPANKTVASPKPAVPLPVEKPNPPKTELASVTQPAQPKASDKARPQSPAILSCGKAETIVDGYGFSRVKPSDCDGQVFTFNATRDGKPFLITVNATSGELIEVRKLPPTATP